MQNQPLVVQQQSTKFLQNDEICHINMAYYNKQIKSLYIPSYLRIVIKNIKSLDFQSLQGSLNLTIVLNTNTWGLPQSIVTFIQENIVMSFNRNQTLQLGKGADHMVQNSVIEKMKKSLRKNKNIDQKPQKLLNNQITNPNQQSKTKQKKVKIGSKYTKRLTRNATLQPYVFFTPFQLIDLVISIQLPDLKYQDQSNNQSYIVKFNIMKRQQLQNQSLLGKMPIISKMISSSCTTDFGVYSIATKRMDVEYSSSRTHTTLMKLGKNFYNYDGLDHKRQKIKQGKKENYQKSIKYGHFHVPLSKHPLNVLTTLFIPLWLFSFINLSIFTLPPSLGSRIGAIATVMLAFVSLIPSIREQIPTSPTFTVFQGLVYLQTVNSILCLFQSLYVQDESQDAGDIFMQNYRPGRDGLYLISCVITSIIIVIPVLMFLWYKLVLRKSHYFGNQQTLGNDKSFEEWIGCEEGNRRFLNEKCRKMLIFSDEDMQSQIKLTKKPSNKKIKKHLDSSPTISDKNINIKQSQFNKFNELNIVGEDNIKQNVNASRNSIENFINEGKEYVDKKQV